MPLKSKVTTQEIDKGFAEILEEAGFAKGKSFLKVGVLSKDGQKIEPGGNFNLAQIAAVHEFGSKKAGIPERSWMRSTMDENQQKYFALSFKLLAQVGVKGMKIRKALNLMGLQIASDFKRKITILRDPPNSPATIRRKGSTNPLIDTGRMRNSQNHQVTLKKKKVSA